MSGYRRGAVLGLTVAETFILLTFLLLVALLGLVEHEEPLPNADAAGAPRVWVRPDEIETLVNAAKEARRAGQEADQARTVAERARDQAHEKAEQAVEAQKNAEQARTAAERERDLARKAREEAEQGRAAAERERDLVRKKVEEVRRAQREAEQARATAERERDQTQEHLALLRRKGKNPPCWYQIVNAGEGKTREKPYYIFNVAIYEDAIEIAPRTAPPAGAIDDGGGSYADEWKRLRVEELPYGKRMSDREFTEAISNLVAQGRNRQVRTYECVFSVMVWDKTPNHAKKRWQDAHDRIIEGSFSAYTVRDLEWTGIER